MRSVFAGYRIMEFVPASKESLRAIAAHLKPNETAIVERWTNMQCDVYLPPRLTRAELHDTFARLFHRMLELLAEERPEAFIDEMYAAGADLAGREFPYEAIIMSIHFLEESYGPYLASGPKMHERLIWMDEFLHMVLGALATSYFRAYREALLGEAEVGRIVQEGLMPKIPMRAADLEVAYIYQSSTERGLVGGDILDVFELEDGTVAFLVGDVAGHGVSASNDAALLRHLFRGFMRETESLAEAIQRVNRVLAAELPPDRFITALCGFYDPVAGCLQLVNAGHPRPLLCLDGCREAQVTGMLLGVMETAGYAETEVSLARGEVFAAYTDGLVEARRDGEFYGEARIAESLQAVRDAGPQAIAEYLRDEALTFSGGKLGDDMAVLILKRL